MLGYKMVRKIACPKNDLTIVFVAQSTNPPIKNGANFNCLK